MEILYFVVLNALGHLAFVGSRMTTSLYALELGASEATVGTLMALATRLAYRLLGKPAPVDEPEPESIAQPRITRPHALTA